MQSQEKETKDKKITAKVTLHHYRFPKEGIPVPGKYAIVVFNVEEILEGEINPEYFYQNNKFIVTGPMPVIEKGMNYIFTGKYVVDKKWGGQFECMEIHLAYDMKDPEEQKKFLSFFMTDKQINTLYNSHEDPMKLLQEGNLNALTQIKGIGPATAQRMCNRYAENKGNGRAYVELKELGLTKNAIDKIVKTLGSIDVAIDIVKQNPYSLISLVKGYGWEKADKIALAQGFGHGCKERCMAYTAYRLQKNGNDDGNSRMNIDELMADVEHTCAPTDHKTLASWIKTDMVSEDKFEELYQRQLEGENIPSYPQFLYDPNSKSVGLTYFRLLEKKISTQLQVLNEAQGKYIFNSEICNKIIEEVELEQGYTYTHEQKKAIDNILSKKVNILIGCAGTGKSSTLKPLVQIFKYYGLEVAQCALSGRAASLLTEYTGLEGKTIHRLLGYLPEEERFNHTKRNPLFYDVIILDEASMVGEELFLSLIEAIKPGSKLIILGDTKQLPPISVGNVLSDCIGSGYINVNKLTIIQRQAARSGIITQSLKVCNGEHIVKRDFSGEDIRGEIQDFKLISNADVSLVHRAAVEEFKRLYYTCKIPVDDIQIVVPNRTRGNNSCRVFNEEVQNIVNRKTKKFVEEEVFDNTMRYTVTYRPGDRIIITRNNYSAKKPSGEMTAVFNGNMGHIIDVDNESMLVEMNNKERIIIPRADWNTIAHSYAVSCHKCQGSQAPYVIVVMDNGAFSLLSREWLYTALTRARKYCALVAQPSAVITAIRNGSVKIKQTWLKNDLYKLYLNKVARENPETN